MICVSSFTCGSKLFLEDLYSILKSKINNLRGSFIFRKRKNHIIVNHVRKEFDSRCYELQFSKNDAIRIRTFMYRDKCICLKRKKKIFLELGEITKNIFGFREYNEAKKYARSLKLYGWEQWQDFYSKNKRPSDIPYHPSITYKGKGWISWQDFLGFEKIGRKRFFKN